MPHHASQPAKTAKRILVVSQHFAPENFRINDIVDGFLDDGIEVDVLCGLPNYPKGEWFPGFCYTGPRRQRYIDGQLLSGKAAMANATAEGKTDAHAYPLSANIFRSGEIRRKGNTSLRIFLNYCSFPFYALFNLPRLRGRKYDAVFCYETSPVLMILPAILYAKTHKVPLCTYVLDLWPDNLYSVLDIQSPFLRKIATAVSRWHYRRCTRLVAMSPSQAERLSAMCTHKGLCPPMQVIPQYSEDFYAEDREDPAVGKYFEGKFTLLFAGNLSPAQDLENLLRAMARLQDIPNLQLIILGDGMSRESLEKQVTESGLSDRVHFMGQVAATDIPCWTHYADALFAGLAQSENLSLTVPAKIASYMAAGRPLLVATGGEGERAAIESGSALVSTPADDAALAENIRQMMAFSDQQRAQMGQAGRAYYRTHYRRADLLRKLEKFILNAE